MQSLFLPALLVQSVYKSVGRLHPGEYARIRARCEETCETHASVLGILKVNVIMALWKS